MTAPYYGCEPSDGLHVLKDHWGQKRYLEPQAMRLSQELNLAIETTLSAAPEGRQDYRLERETPEKIDQTEQERRLEAAMMKRWNAPEMSLIAGAWDRLIAFQVPLFAKQQKRSWGYIDLLGVNGDGLPVVVELKRSPVAKPNGQTTHSESPLRMILEAAAYAVALRKNWAPFREQWITRLTGLAVSPDVLKRVPEKLETVPLVAAAPADYWIGWLPVSGKGQRVTPQAWREFATLLSELNEHSLPVSFVSISGHAGAPETLAAEPLEHFPPIFAPGEADIRQWWACPPHDSVQEHQPEEVLIVTESFAPGTRSTSPPGQALTNTANQTPGTRTSGGT